MKADIELLRRLVEIPSETRDIAANDRAQDLLADWLRARNVRTAFERAPDGRKILYASTCPGTVQDYLFNAHTDVVPADSEMFRPAVRDGWMFGRGTGDCKGNVVLIARLLTELNGRASVGAVFSSDEESAGTAAETMVRLGYGARRLVVVLDSQPYSLCVAEKGHAYFTLRAKGRACHSSRPWEGENAIDRLVDGYLKVREVLPRDATKDAPWAETLVPTVMRAGAAPNGIPGVATMTLNLRFVDEAAVDAWVRRLEEVSGLEVVRGECFPVVRSDSNAPIVQTLADHLRRAWPGRPVPFVRMNGATDARSFIRLGVPLVITSAEKRGDHADAECVRLDSLDEVADALRDFILGNEEGRP